MKHFFLICLVALMSHSIVAQETDTIPQQQENPQEKEEQKAKKTNKTPLIKKLYFGGGVGISFGNYTRIAVYPMVGYKITPKLSAGIELGYEWISDKRYNETYTTSNYGGSLFARYRIIPALFFHAEYATYNYELYYLDASSERLWVPFLFLGAGFSKRIAPGTTAYAMVKFDVLQNKNSPYKDWDPFFNVGISVGF
jgi:hypothetical protein